MTVSLFSGMATCSDSSCMFPAQLMKLASSPRSPGSWVLLVRCHSPGARCSLVLGWSFFFRPLTNVKSYRTLLWFFKEKNMSWGHTNIFQFQILDCRVLTSFIFIFLCRFSYTKNLTLNDNRIVTYLLCPTYTYI